MTTDTARFDTGDSSSSDAAPIALGHFVDVGRADDYKAFTLTGFGEEKDG